MALQNPSEHISREASLSTLSTADRPPRNPDRQQRNKLCAFSHSFCMSGLSLAWSLAASSIRCARKQYMSNALCMRKKEEKLYEEREKTCKQTSNGFLQAPREMDKVRLHDTRCSNRRILGVFLT